MEHIQPQLLPPADVTDLARDRLGGEPAGAVRRMLSGTGGNPRLAVEVIEGLARAAARGEPQDRIPSALVRIVRRAVNRLGHGEREVAGLLAGSGSVAGFRFELVREAVYGDLPPRRRAALHRRCGNHLIAERDVAGAVRYARAVAADGDPGGAALILRKAAELVPEPAEAAGPEQLSR